MIIATQNCNRVYFTENHDSIEIEGDSIVLNRDNGDLLRMKRYVLGQYESLERAHEVLRDIVANLDAGGLILPEK